MVSDFLKITLAASGKEHQASKLLLLLLLLLLLFWSKNFMIDVNHAKQPEVWDSFKETVNVTLSKIPIWKWFVYGEHTTFINKRIKKFLKRLLYELFLRN